ncbi:DUF2330 domain-containing protein [Nocardia arthritidis]|uniref:DUF2330 domain-containing protein n=1 Tax=Nocardia arthritidis TaxID=228602 RepID=A0A6G9Y610_9NOCA|nr:DUF2330 domain-containing protein [Nocardia arthritidis]QIS08527.1 DUF2330 domain-containing protein [Nocardia arthritidis]
MRFAIIARLGTAAAVLLGCVGIGALAPASACACGGVIPKAGDLGSTATVNREVALLGWDGRRETIVMQLALRSGIDTAALIVPTPTPATVTAGAPQTFKELEARTAPQVVTHYRWLSKIGAGASSAAAPATAGPTVLGRVQLGPLEATTLTGGDLDGIRKWLTDNGYQTKPEVVDAMAPYLRDGWSFVAMRLTSDQPLSGALDPVRFEFDTDRLVYPMRMSAAAKSSQTVVLYVLGEHRMRRTDPDANKQSSDVEFADRATDFADADLARLSGGGHDYLTGLRVTIDNPAAISTDFTFAAADSDEPYHQIVERTENAEILGVPGGVILYGALATIGLFALAFILFPGRRGPRDGWAA